MTQFTPWSSLLGGVLIGFSAIVLLILNGRIAGISGVLSRILLPAHCKSELPWELAFVVGLVAAPFIYSLAGGVLPALAISPNALLVGVAGLLVGFGSVLGGGCTSGHGVCGLSRLSKRSIIATLSFMTTGAVTVYLIRHVFGG
nr:YeeE/YedE family protein [Pseudovibrio hongkongensis]